MHNQRFFDQTLSMIDSGYYATALPMLAGKLHNAHAATASWPETRAALHDHRLHEVLLQDPLSAYSARRPRGYPGDAGLIDMIYDKVPAFDASNQGREIFALTVQFQAPEGVRQRRLHAETVIDKAWRQGKRILVLACGHFREADTLIGEDISNVVLVDQDAVSLEVVRRNHGDFPEIHEANVFRYLRAASSRGARFDLIYTLGLTDYLDRRAMELLHRMTKACLAPGGSFLLANFLPGHLATGWMDAVMDWHLIYREEDELEGCAAEVGLIPRTWRDPTGSVVWCEMENRT
jgi:hypothetical protein